MPRIVASIGSIIGPRKKTKQDYVERMESIKNGREGREFGSCKGSNERGLTTNKEKSKDKNFMMIAHKREAREKKSLRGERSRSNSMRTSRSKR
ncbi:Severe Depolymerization of Actin [Podila clonocystis]|nr:Severe Depolymerization of Actin [Podila clonocystis]